MKELLKDKETLIEIVGGFLCVVVGFVLCGIYLYIFG
jgi:hypothetical protein